MLHNRLLFWLILLSADDLFAQSSPYFFDGGKIRNYKVVIESPLYYCNITGVILDSVVMVAEPGALFTVVGVKDDLLIIRFWAWKENSSLNKLLCYADSLGVKRKYFLMAECDLESKSLPRYDRDVTFTAGTILIPFKLRIQKFDFSKDFTLGPSAGLRFRLSSYRKNFVNLMTGMGITSVTVNSRSAKGVTEDEEMEVPALTPSFGFVFEFTNAAQAGVFVGCDYIANNEKIKLIYHGKPWLSFGIGLSLLSPEGAADTIEKKH